MATAGDNILYITAGLAVAKNSGQSPTSKDNTLFVTAGLAAEVEAGLTLTPAPLQVAATFPAMTLTMILNLSPLQIAMTFPAMTMGFVLTPDPIQAAVSFPSLLLSGADFPVGVAFPVFTGKSARKYRAMHRWAFRRFS